MVLDGHTPIDTGSTKVGALIGDHTKTSIGTLFNTGAYVGAMALIAATGKPLPKFIPSFAWFLEGVVTKGFGKRKLYETAGHRHGPPQVPLDRGRRGPVGRDLQDDRAQRDEAIKKGRRAMAAAERITSCDRHGSLDAREG